MPSWKVLLEEDGYSLESKEDKEYSPGKGVLEHAVIQDVSELYRLYD